ncbi:hypothetical protein [Trebonia kvetii]|uniref:hypothetical protein n=1 Tax=Trebonia kvetii TaxID=2480626 RepID=UPI0034E0CAD6
MPGPWEWDVKRLAVRRQLRVARLRQRTSLRVLPKLTTAANGTRKIIDDPPLIGHLDSETFDGAAMIACSPPPMPIKSPAITRTGHSGTVRARGRDTGRMRLAPGRADGDGCSCSSGTC